MGTRVSAGPDERQRLYGLWNLEDKKKGPRSLSPPETTRMGGNLSGQQPIVNKLKRRGNSENRRIRDRKNGIITAEGFSGSPFLPIPVSLEGSKLHRSEKDWGVVKR